MLVPPSDASPGSSWVGPVMRCQRADATVTRRAMIQSQTERFMGIFLGWVFLGFGLGRIRMTRDRA